MQESVAHSRESGRELGERFTQIQLQEESIKI